MVILRQIMVRVRIVWQSLTNENVLKSPVIVCHSRSWMHRFPARTDGFCHTHMWPLVLMTKQWFQNWSWWDQLKSKEILSLRGLARHCEHTTANWDQFGNIPQKVQNYPDGVFLVSPWPIKSRFYKKNWVWNITHHASHITNHMLPMNF